jgi:hypothetical protein
MLRIGHSLPLLGLVILLVACGTTPSSSPAASASAAPSAPAASATVSAAPSTAPSDDPSSEACESSFVAPPGDWSVVGSDDPAFSVGMPAGWSDLSEGLTYQPGTLFDAQTFAETGLAAGTEVPIDLLAQSTAGTPAFAVFAVDGVSSTTDVVYDRQLAKLESEPFISEVLSTDLSGCLAGAPALGLEVTGFNTELDPATGEVVPTGEEVYAQYWMVVRDGTLFFAQWVDAPTPDLATLDRVLVSWAWSAPVAEEPEPGSGAIAEAGMALEPPDSSAPLGPGTFQSTFASDAAAIYVIYELAPDSATLVTFTWRREGEVLITQSFDWTSEITRAWAYITPPGGGFDPGSYEVELQLEATGESRVVPFTVEGP